MNGYCDYHNASYCWQPKKQEVGFSAQERFVIKDNDDFRTAIKMIMDENGIGQNDMAKRLNCSRQSIGNTLRKTGGGIDSRNLIRIIGSLGYQIEITRREDSDS